ncbi:MAG: 50S ribosomal protein L7Ae [Candidatus Thermoplasmatota archaeon]|nr:50S ribosomal protein L7Ae [Candidatus Thermoplasmatota archaeon]MCL5988262.1 50S ribosomal protein L7Ae [Candidatus Thermoplasmatota archaeon]
MDKATYVRFETPESLEKKILEFVENSYRNGKIKKGTNEVIKTIENGTSKLVVISEDVNPPEVVYFLPKLCEERKVAFAYVKNKSDLGARVGIGSAASISIVDFGKNDELYKQITSELSEIGK